VLKWLEWGGGDKIEKSGVLKPAFREFEESTKYFLDFLKKEQAKITLEEKP